MALRIRNLSGGFTVEPESVLSCTAESVALDPTTHTNVRLIEDNEKLMLVADILSHGYVRNNTLVTSCSIGRSEELVGWEEGRGRSTYSDSGRELAYHTPIYHDVIKTSRNLKSWRSYKHVGENFRRVSRIDWEV